MIRRLTDVVPNLELLPQQQLSWVERIAPFASDCLINLFLLPALATALLAIGKKLGLALTASLAIALIILTHLQGLSMRVMGSMQTYDAYIEAMQWGAANSELSKEYIMAYKGAHAKALAAIAATVLVSFLLSRNSKPLQRTSKWTMIVCQVAVLLASICYCFAQAKTSFHQSYLTQSLGQLLRLTGDSETYYSNFSLEQCRAEYFRLAGQKGAQGSSTGSNRLSNEFDGHRDIVWFQFETLPAEWADFTQSCDDLPNIKKLSEYAIVCANNFSPYPATIPATWSALTGCYPLNEISLRQESDRGCFPALPLLLSQKGYETAMFMPDDLGRFRATLSALGINKIESSETVPHGRLANMSQISLRIDRDLDMLARSKRHIEETTAAGKNYFLIFAPQVGHGPWKSPTTTSSHATKPEDKCREILRLQDKWVGQIMETIKSSGRMERTIFLLLGDHGIRTKLEDPSLDLGGIDSRMYKVPLMIAAPGLLSEKIIINATTSHIDIVPTIEQLMGIETGGFSQGACIFDLDGLERFVFLLGKHFNGKDGLVSDGVIYPSDSDSDIEHLQTTKSSSITVEKRCAELRGLVRRWLRLHHKESR